MWQKRPGSPKQRNEKSYSKPPLPSNVMSQIRKGTYHVSLDFVQSLCETSYGLVDIVPIEDRKSALREVAYVLFFFGYLSNYLHLIVKITVSLCVRHLEYADNCDPFVASLL